jgi:hypothetical protein
MPEVRNPNAYRLGQEHRKTVDQEQRLPGPGDHPVIMR